MDTPKNAHNTHIDLKNVSKQINKNLISKKILTINNDYKRLFKITPKIALLGLNPHNLELSARSEEKKIKNQDSSISFRN